ncbi:MFS transporter [Streptacidiphilus sp. MAP12-16]|uniref:MFS transporter n=1 Tax=Streptacidiphilus sp. MAP12-16 TaxID=3156300 RepID=UPI003510F912
MRRWHALDVLALAHLMLLVDTVVVSLALAPVQRDLHFSAGGLAWVVNGYALPFGGLLLLGGRLADLLGRRRMSVVGLVLFASASAGCGAATNAAMLVAARFAQGVGAAAAAPAALSLVTVLFTEAGDRQRAMKMWSALRGVGNVIGMLLGGVLVTFLDWRWVFFINLPIAAAALTLTPRLVPRIERAPWRRPDPPGHCW